MLRRTSQTIKKATAAATAASAITLTAFAITAITEPNAGHARHEDEAKAKLNEASTTGHPKQGEAL